MQEVEELSKSRTEIGRNVNKALSAITLVKLERVSRALIGNLQDGRAENLLTSARKVYMDLLGSESPSIADINILLADCYLKQQEIPKVKALLLESVSIYEKTKGLKDRKTIMAVLKLGQLDRNENNSAMAKQELEKALKAADQYLPEDKYLRSLCTRSYADYLDRTGNHLDATNLYTKADGLFPTVDTDDQ